MIVCAVCFAAGRPNVPATQRHPAGRASSVCEECADAITDAMAAAWDIAAQEAAIEAYEP